MSKVLSNLNPVLHLDQSLVVKVVNDLSAYPKVDGAKVVLCLGQETRLKLAELGVVPKNRTTNSLRGQSYSVPGNPSPAMLSYSIGVSQIDYAMYVDLLCDTRVAMRFVETGTMDPLLGVYNVVPDFRDFLFRAYARYESTGKVVDIAFDTETVGLDPYDPTKWLLSIQVCMEEGSAEMVYFPTLEDMEDRITSMEWVEPLVMLLNDPKFSLRMANGKYDLTWMKVKCGIGCTNFKFDTTLVGNLLDENRSNALDVHAKVYTPMGGYSDIFDKTTDKSRMDLVPLAPLTIYACGDADATLRVSKVERKELVVDENLANFYVNILHPAARAFEEVEQAGVCLDMGAYAELENELVVCMAGLTATAKKIVGSNIVSRHVPKPGKTLNITKPSFLIDFMFSPLGLNLKPKMWTAGGKDGEGEKKPSTAIDHLLMFEDVAKAKDFVGLLKEYGSASKTLSTYVRGFKEHIRSDGKFHPSYRLHRGNHDEGEGGSVTGRLSCKDPAFQTIPKHTVWSDKLRRCIVAPPGYQILSFDYSQGELRVIACIADEKTMIKAYRDGMDLHALTAGTFRGYTYQQMMELMVSNNNLYKEIRHLGKAGNFGLIYGMGEKGFGVYAYLNYGVRLKQSEISTFRDGFFETYSELPKYHAQYKAQAHKYGEVRSPLGRIRHLPLINSTLKEVQAKAERQAINAPVQSTLTDMSLLAAVELEKIGFLKEAPMFGQVHDQMLFYVPDDRVVECAKIAKQVLENLPFVKFGWEPQLKFIVDATYGKNLADQEELVL